MFELSSDQFRAAVDASLDIINSQSGTINTAFQNKVPTFQHKDGRKQLNEKITFMRKTI